MSLKKKVDELAASLTSDQREELKEKLGDKMYALLDNMTKAEDDDGAQAAIDSFIAAAKKKPMKVLKARRVLTRGQRKIIEDFFEEE